MQKKRQGQGQDLGRSGRIQTAVFDQKLKDLGDPDDLIIADANEQVRKLAEETAIAAELFADVGVQVEEQGQMLAQVEDNVEGTDEALAAGVNELSKIRCCACCACFSCLFSCCS